MFQDSEPHPEIPEGINTSKTHPLSEFAYLLGGAALVVLAILFLAQALAGVMVHYISFETESALYYQLAGDDFEGDVKEHLQKTEYLQSLADNLAELMDLPEGMVIRAHYDDSDVANAYATLAGNIVIYQGLINEVSSENGLAMVVAHEIAHIKYRDPLMSLGRGTISIIGLAILAGVGDSSAFGNIVNITGGGLLAKFSRDQESRADQDAVEAIYNLYGTLEGADEFFVNMSKEDAELGVVFFSTHPATDSRIERIANAGVANGISKFELTPLPEILSNAQEFESIRSID